MTQAFEPMNFTPHPIVGGAQTATGLVIPASQRNSTVLPNRDIALPEGVNRVMLEWQGTKSLHVRVIRSGESQSNIIKTMPPGQSLTLTIPCRGPGSRIWFSQVEAITAEDEKHHLAVTIIPGPPVGAGGVVSGRFLGLLADWLRGGRNDHTGHVRHDVGDYAPRSHGVSIPTGAENPRPDSHSALDPCENPAPFRYDYGDDRLVGIIRPANSSEERRHQLPHEECGISYLRHPENAVAAPPHRIHRAHPRYHRHQPHPGGPGQSTLRSSDNSSVLAFSGVAA